MEPDGDESFPAEDVSVEAQPCLGQIETSVYEDVTLKSTRVVRHQNLLWSHVLEQFLERIEI